MLYEQSEVQKDVMSSANQDKEVEVSGYHTVGTDTEPSRWRS